ncbi:MAG TPA: hypothetical protein VGP47_01545 [Parachlamydiaceae bacterium]|nr:hypothetical protein [Parachlamydiaceae bacterium]
MTEDLIQLPNIEEIKEMLDVAKRDIQTEVEQDPELQPASELLVQVISVIDDKLSKSKAFEQLNQAEKIDIAAHLNFLQALLEDFFMFDDEFDEFEDDEEMEDDEAEEDEVEKK